MRTSTPRVLSIAGTDPTGGAGSQADTKSISSAGGFALAVTTAIVAQNTQGVKHVHLPNVTHITAQLEAVSADVEVDALKIGMLASTDYIAAVKNWLGKHPIPVVVIDPVMVATSHDRLLEKGAESALIDLLQLATVIIPNILELEVIAGLEEGSITGFDQSLRVAQEVAATHDTLVMVKGGHLNKDAINNALVGSRGVVAQSQSPRVDTPTPTAPAAPFPLRWPPGWPPAMAFRRRSIGAPSGSTRRS